MKLQSIAKKKLQKLAPLRAGDTIGVFAPGSPIEPQALSRGISAIENAGYKVSVPRDPSAAFGKDDYTFGSASVADRIKVFYSLLEDPAVKVVIAARGGYGSLELLPYLDFDRIKRSPKLIVGISDVTALLVPIAARCEVPTIHGPILATGFSRAGESTDAAWSVSTLMTLFSSPMPAPDVLLSAVRGGVGEGPIIAGNLTMLLALQGTPWDVSYDGAILILEDINEPPYRVRRALAQLKLAGKLEKLAGLVFGSFTYESAVVGASMDDVLRGSVSDLLAGTQYPVLHGFPFGHTAKNHAVAIGCRAKISDGKLSFVESPVA